LADETSTGERIAKYLARAGIASRREVERMIEADRVVVNGKRLDTPAFKVTASDRIEVDGKIVEPPAETQLWRYHKPTGLVTTHKDPEGRDTVFDKLPKELGRVISVGRLDLTSEGLLLLTNDGGLARALELPSTGWTRRYRARAFGTIDNAAIAKLRAGVTVEGIKYGPMEVEVERETGSNIWLTIGIREGKNREVRRALDSVGLRVNRLIRTAYGPFQLGQMDPGEIKAVPARILKDQCGHLLPDDALKDEGTGRAKAVKPAGRKQGARPGGKPGGKPGQKSVEGRTLDARAGHRPGHSKSDPPHKGAGGKTTDEKRPGGKGPGHRGPGGKPNRGKASERPARRDGPARKGPRS
jgi:23S rRNA pseudouridine2605 synthase